MTIGKIKRVPLREVWKHEALDFTTWLQENIDVLSDALGFTLQNAEKEQSAGDFSVDLVAEQPDGKPAVIENQLEKSDHDHLGKLVTYVSALNASCGVWIVAQPRPEHVQGIVWLNESGLANFYLVKVEAIRIGDSPPAPLLTVITGPTEEGRLIGDTKKQFVERHDLRNRFWQALLDRAKPKTKLHANISPTDYSWISASAGKNGLSFQYSVTRHANTAELVIDRGKDSDDENRAIFEQLRQHKAEIESAFGGPLDWYTQEGVRLRRIRFAQNGGYRDDESQWAPIQDNMIEAMIRLEKAIRPFINGLQLS